MDHLFASKQIDSNRLKEITTEIAKLQGELRYVHLMAHLEMRQLLTEEQVRKYDQLRGYKDGEHKKH
jgi:Spy/CpxP family protein refolding chaperone